MIKKVSAYLSKNVPAAPLAVFRIVFGLLMLVSLIRFVMKGWVHSMYVMPKMFFPYFGFEWVKPLGAEGMYIVFGLMILASLGIVLGAFYRICTILFFVLFTYVELIDKTNYLNHYYFISLVSFLMMFVPADRCFSVDNILKGRAGLTRVARVNIFILQLQMFLVYFFAGVAKINSDWLLDAQPLRTWLPAFSHLPVIGSFMETAWIAYVFSWFGCLYDLSIGFLLFSRRTVGFAYCLVVLFHLATAIFFNIGMFPYVMMSITLVFFPGEFFERIIARLRSLVPLRRTSNSRWLPASPVKTGNIFYTLMAVYFLLQVMAPFRYLLYKGDLFWTEQGYRFSWRVMLMEKAGSAFFTVRDAATGGATEVVNSEFLTPMQEKMMATQPDMLVDYARFLRDEFRSRGFSEPVVNAQCFVTVNGCGSREFIDPSVDLASQSNSFLVAKNWVKSY